MSRRLFGRPNRGWLPSESEKQRILMGLRALAKVPGNSFDAVWADSPFLRVRKGPEGDRLHLPWADAYELVDNAASLASRPADGILGKKGIA